MKNNKTINLETFNNAEIDQTTKIDASVETSKDYAYYIKSKGGKEKTIKITNYSDEISEIFEINGVAIFGEHLRLLRDFLGK